LSWTIAKADYDMLGVAMENKAVTHDGQAHSITISGTLPAGVSVASYTGNGQTAEGVYTITATFSVADPANYKVPAPMTATLTINEKRTYKMDGITFENKTVTYDGQAHSIVIGGTLPMGVDVSYTYDGQAAAGKTEVGKYRVEAVFTTSDPTYNVPQTMVAELEIKAAGGGGNEGGGNEGGGNEGGGNEGGNNGGNPIKGNNIQKSDGRVGIRLTSGNIVSQKAEFEVILPDNDKVQKVKTVIYDNTGNVVFDRVERGARVSWNLTNNAGRNVANGTYLIIAEARGAKGSYTYSAKVGVKR